MESIMTNRLDRGFNMYREQFESAALRVLRSGWYIMGRELENFERDFAAYCGAKCCVGTGNGLDALYLACRALGIKTGDEVIVQGNTFIASVMGITMTGATPVFVEPDEYYEINEELIEEKINEKTKAVMVVHLYGQTAEMDKITEICEKHSLKLIEDCAQSHGAKYKGQMSGTFGSAGCFSFYPSKNLGAFGDGGAVITDDEKTDKTLRMLRNYGSAKRYYNDVVGVNSRLDEMQAALLDVRLKHLDALTLERRRIAERYLNEINNPKIILPKTREGSEHVYHQFVIRCAKRDELAAYLKEKGIDTIVHYPIPPHLSKAYEYLGIRKGSLPLTEEYADTVLSIPMYNGITKEEQDTVIGALNSYA